VLLELVDVPELNRSEGCAAGDAAIRAAARAVAAAATRLDGTAARYGGRRLGLAVPRYDLDRAKVLAEELADQSAAESTVRYGAAAWEPGDAGIDVIERARRALAAAAAASDGSHAGVGGDGADMAEKEPAHAGESPASA
jgi:GGDEF domain-containing protein